MNAIPDNVAQLPAPRERARRYECLACSAHSANPEWCPVCEGRRLREVRMNDGRLAEKITLPPRRGAMHLLGSASGS